MDTGEEPLTRKIHFAHGEKSVVAASKLARRWEGWLAVLTCRSEAMQTRSKTWLNIVSADETVDGQTTDNHRKPFYQRAFNCDLQKAEVFCSMITTTECYKITKTQHFVLEHTIMMLTPLCELHTGGRP